MARRKGKPYDPMSFCAEATSKERSLAQETRVAGYTQGKVQKGSGAVMGKKGDVDDVPLVSLPVGKYKIEAKTTKHMSYSVNMAELNKIENEAMAEGKKGLMVVTLEDKYDYVVIRKEYLNFGEGRRKFS